MPTRPSAATAATPHPLISDARLQHLYVTLLRTRLLRQRNRPRKAAAPLVAPEAIVTGTVTHLKDGDTVMPAAEDGLAALARGHAVRHVLGSVGLPGILSSAPTAEARFAIATGRARARSKSSSRSAAPASSHWMRCAPRCPMPPSTNWASSSSLKPPRTPT